MATYASNSEILFDNGRDVNDLLDPSLDADGIRTTLRSARQRAFNTINARLQGKTAIPANHIPVLRQVEIDMVLTDLISSAFTMETANISEWGEKYSQRFDDTLSNLFFIASAEASIAHRSNTGNGNLNMIEVNSETAKDELWTFSALSPTEFVVTGSVSGRYPNLTVGEDYPNPSETGYRTDYQLDVSYYPNFALYPFYCKVIAGTTPFAQYDSFKVQIYGSSSFGSRISTGKIVRA